MRAELASSARVRTGEHGSKGGREELVRGWRGEIPKMVGDGIGCRNSAASGGFSSERKHMT